jgi:transposase-like protein
VQSQATVVAVGVTSEGERQVLGVDVGPSDDRAFWTAFLRSLVKRGRRGVRLVISDAHEGLKQAIATVLTGTTWQRCRVHFMRNLLATVPQGAREPIAASVRTIFAQPARDGDGAAAQGRRRPPCTPPSCLSQMNEWSIAERRYFSAESMKQLSAPALPPSAQELLAAIA